MAGRNGQLYCHFPHEQDESWPSLLFAGTSACCIQKRSGLVPTVSVISFGLLICFGPAALCRLHAKQQALLRFLMNKMDRDLPSCLRALWHVYRRGLDWFQQPWSFRSGLTMCFGLYCACCWLHGWTKLTALLLGFLLMNKMDRDLPSCLRALWHVYRRGLDWFQQPWSFRSGLTMCFDLYCACCWLHGWTKLTALLLWFLLMNKMDRDLPSCLRALWHVYRRGLGDFESVEMDAWGSSFALAQLALASMHSWTQWTALLQFLMNCMDCKLPPSLRVLRHVYRRGLDWFQQHWSFRLG
jgi:hypothetical protein